MNNLSFPLDAIMGSFLPHRLHMRLSGRGEDYTPDNASNQEIATWVHENTHFFQTIFTGYGQIAWDTHRQMTSFLIHEWVKGHKNNINNEFRIPLGHFAKFSKEHLLHALQIYNTAKDMIMLGKARFLLESPGGKISDLNLLLLKEEWPVNPTIEIAGKQHFLQGKEIIEGQAQFAETTFLEKQCDISREKAWSRDSLPTQYLVALDWFLEQCGEEYYHHFPFICDLALQTSWENPVPKTEQEWQETSPSWRFVRLTKTLRNIKSSYLGQPSDWPKTYESYASVILNQCGYKNLEIVFEERIAALNRKEILLNFEKLMKNAIIFRQKKPWCAGNPIEHMKLWEKMKETFPAPIIEINGKLTGEGLGHENKNIEIAAELHLQALAAQIFGDFSKYAICEKSIECGFSKYDISQGCEYQRTDFCKGRYQPIEGPPHKVSVSSEQTLKGCTFEFMLNSFGVKSEKLSLDHLAQLPTFEELKHKKMLNTGSQKLAS